MPKHHNTIFKKLNEEEDTQSNQNNGAPSETELELENINGYIDIKDLESDYKEIYCSSYEHYILPENTEFDNHLQNCKQMYINSQNSKLGFFLLGNTDLQIEETMAPKPMITKTLSENFHYITDNIDNTNINNKKTLGSILNSGNWSFLLNDAFILGAISKRTHFYLVTPRYSTGAITTASTGWAEIRAVKKDDHLRLTMYAREIIAALAAGYEIRKLADGSEILVPSEDMRGLTLKELIIAVSHFEQTINWTAIKSVKLKSIIFDFKKKKVSKFIYN